MSSDHRTRLQQLRRARARSMDSFIDSQFDLSFAVQLLEKFSLRVTPARILDLSPAKLDVALHPQDYCSLRFGWCSPRNVSTNETLRGIDQHTVGFTVRPLRNVTSKRIRSVSVHIGQLQSCAVHYGSVTVGARKYDRIIGGNLIELSARWKYRRLPESFDPAASGDPFAAACLVHPRFNSGQKFFQAVNTFEVQRHLSKANPGQMLV